MTTTQVFEVFDILQDKYGAPYFPSDWKIELFNLSQNQYLGELFPDNQGGIVNFETNTHLIHNVKPLVFSLNLNTTSGLITNSVIETALQTASSQASAKIFRIASMRAESSGNYYPIKPAKHNNIWEYYNNTWKIPTAPERMRYTVEADGYHFYPTSDSTNLRITVIKTPLPITLAVDPEFPDYSVYNIIAIMLMKAGIASRDEELIQEIKTTAQ